MRRFLPYIVLLLFIAGYQSNGICAGKPIGHKQHVRQIIFKNAIEPDPAPYGDFKTLTVPIKRAGNLIVVEAQIDTLEGNFILDTGAPYLVLNKTYFRDAPRISEKEAAGVNGSVDGTFTTSVKNFSILDLHYDRLTADVTDLSGIENSRNIKVLGLLGTRLFSKFAITVDLAQGVMYIHKLDDKGNIPTEDRVFAQPTFKTPFRLLNNVVFLPGVANDQKMWFAFDSGAESNLLDYETNKKLVRTMQPINRSKLTGVGGTSYEIIYAQFNSLLVGGYQLTQNHILITDLEKMGKAYGYSVEAILGYDFFSRGIFTVNFVKKEFEMYIYNHQ